MDAQEGGSTHISHGPPAEDAAWKHNSFSAQPYSCLYFGVFTKNFYRNLNASVYPGLSSSLLPLPLASMGLAAPGV